MATRAKTPRDPVDNVFRGRQANNLWRYLNLPRAAEGRLNGMKTSPYVGFLEHQHYHIHQLRVRSFACRILFVLAICAFCHCAKVSLCCHGAVHVLPKLLVAVCPAVALVLAVDSLELGVVPSSSCALCSSVAIRSAVLKTLEVFIWGTFSLGTYLLLYPRTPCQ